MNNVSWAAFVKVQRKEQGLTRRKLASMADIDPSYVTLIERDGYIPRKDKVCSLARALQVDVDHTLLLAGYAPQKVSVNALLDNIGSVRSERDLVPDLRACVQELFDLDEDQQGKVTEVLGPYIKTLKDLKNKRLANCASGTVSQTVKG